mgnify:CR=1 FL=1
MKKELEEALYKKYPSLFQQKDLPMSHTCMCWGIDCGDGWYELIDKTCAEIMAVCPEAQMEQVKEKFGGLRLYLLGNDAATKIAWDACPKSLKICETCGKSGKTTTEGWIRTECKKCQKERKSHGKKN